MAAAALAGWFLLTWFLGVWLGVTPVLIWYLRGGLWLIGIAGVSGYLMFSMEDEADRGDGSASAVSDIDSAFEAASVLLQAAKGITQINSIPAIFFLGDPGAGKTSTILNSGVEPEVLAKRRSLRLWYANDTVFVDPSGGLMSDPRARMRLFRKFRGSRSSGEDGPSRSVVLLVDCEWFLTAGGMAAAAGKAQEYQGIVSELADSLRTTVPVYVVFSKTDKVPHFDDFVQNLSEVEGSEILGVSLPVIRASEARGLDTEQKGLRLTAAFKTISDSLAYRRGVYLAREQNVEKLANIYEFPREFSKLRPLMVQYLAEVCHARRARDGSSGFLRGFYFTGERDAAAGKAARPVFRQRLIPDVILADQAPARSAAAKLKRNTGLRAAFAGATAVAMALATWLTISFITNSALTNDALEAARPGAPNSLRLLSNTRRTLLKLDQFNEHGVPWRYGAMLYQGSDIRDAVRTNYYAAFRRTLLQPTQKTLVQICTAPRNYGAQGYNYVYDALKAYLITTVHHEKDTPAFLTPILVRHWKKNAGASAGQESLARENFAFYAKELVTADPYPRLEKPDSIAVANARAYLNGFAAQDRVYKTLLAEAGANQKPVIFNADFPGSAETVTNRYRIEPWFTKAGYLNFQNELANPDQYMGAENWVLGTDVPQTLDQVKMVADLRARFDKEFVDAWSSYVASTTVVGFASLQDAAVKLRNLGSPESALLLDLCVVSENTSVASVLVKKAFQPVQAVAPAGCLRQLESGATTLYVESLSGLASAVAAVGSQSANAESMREAASMVNVATNSAKHLALSFQSDTKDGRAAVVLVKTSQLLTDPISHAWDLVNVSR